MPGSNGYAPTFALKPTSARQIRVLAGCSQRELATLIGVTPSTVWSWEHGRRRPRASNHDVYLSTLGQLLLKTLTDF